MVFETKLRIYQATFDKTKYLKIEGLYSTLIVNCILNAFLSYTAIVLNIVKVQALRKTSSLPTPLKTLLLSLTVSDLGVGLLVQPLFVAIIVMKIKAGTENSLYHAVRMAHIIQSFLFRPTLGP